MTRFPTYFCYIPFLIALALGLSGCGNESSNTAAAESMIEIEEVKGPNGGRLLADGDFAVEVTIFETGVDPQFRLYAYQDGELLSPNLVELTLELGRLGNVTDRFEFTAQGDYLLGDGVVTEPHSFVVSINARYQGKNHSWSYDSLEGRTEIADSVAQAAGIKTEIAGAATVDKTIPVTGKIAFAPNATAEIKSPYASRVLSITKTVGDRVRRGEALARLENVSTLQELTITAPNDGVIIERNTNVGDVARDEPLFVIGDMSGLEAQIHVFPKDQAKVRPGMALTLETTMGEIETKVSSFMPMAELASQTLIARAPIPLDTGLFAGMRVNGDITVEIIEAPLAVRTSGLQRFRDFTVVFAKVDETYEVRMLDLGEQDRDWVVVNGGLEPGTEYVTANAFLLKADVEKDGASHDH